MTAVEYTVRPVGRGSVQSASSAQQFRDALKQHPTCGLCGKPTEALTATRRGQTVVINALCHDHSRTHDRDILARDRREVRLTAALKATKKPTRK